MARRSAQGDGARADVTASLFNPEEFVPALFSSALEISGWTSIVIGGAVCLFWSEAAHQGGTVAYVAILFVGGLINMSRGLSLEISVEAAEEGGDLPPASVIDAHRGFRLRMFALVLLNLSVWFCTGALPPGWIGGGIMMGSFAVILSGCLAMRWKTRLPHATPAVAAQAAAAGVTPAVATSSVAAPAVAAATPPGAETYRVVVSGGVGLRTVHELDAPRTGETLAQDYVFVAAESRDFRHQGRLQWIRVPATSSCRGGWVVVAQRDPVFKEKELQILELVPTRLPPQTTTATTPPTAQPAVQKMQVQVTVPAGAGYGATIQLKIPDGRQIQVQVPAGKKQGDTFSVLVPAPAQVAAPLPAATTSAAAGGGEKYRVVYKGGVGMREFAALDAPRTGETLAQGYEFTAASSVGDLGVTYVKVAATSSHGVGWVFVSRPDPSNSTKQLQILERVDADDDGAAAGAAAAAEAAGEEGGGGLFGGMFGGVIGGGPASGPTADQDANATTMVVPASFGELATLAAPSAAASSLTNTYTAIDDARARVEIVVPPGTTISLADASFVDQVAVATVGEAARRAGLREGDVVLEVDGYAKHLASGLERVLRAPSDREQRLVVARVDPALQAKKTSATTNLMCGVSMDSEY